MPYLEELYTFTASRHVPLVLLGDWPKLHRWGYSCIPTAWSVSALDRCKYEREPNFRGVDYTAYQELAAAHDDIYTFSLYDLLTDGDTVRLPVYPLPSPSLLSSPPAPPPPSPPPSIHAQSSA